MSDSVRPHRWQPTRLPCPWDSPGENTGVGCHFLLQCMKVKSESEVAQSFLTLATPWSAAYQAPPSMGFSKQEYWSGVPLPSQKYIGAENKAERIDEKEFLSGHGSAHQLPQQAHGHADVARAVLRVVCLALDGQRASVTD